MAKAQVKRSKNNKPKLGSGRPTTIAKANPGKRGGRPVKKVKVVYDQARVDLLASL